MGIKFMNLPKARQFNIVTRFYDPQKEAMKEREERIRRGLAQDNPEGSSFSYHADIKGKFRSAGKFVNNKTVAEARRKSNMRLIYIVTLLTALVYFFLK